MSTVEMRGHTARILLVVCLLAAAEVQAERLPDSEQAMRHLSEVRQSVDRAKRSWRSSGKSHVSKRSTTLKADDLLLHSVATYCDSFSSDPDVTAYLQASLDSLPLSARDMTGHSNFRSDRKHTVDAKRKGMASAAFPVRVEAQMEGNATWVVLHVAHSQPAAVSHLDPFHFQTTDLGMSEGTCQAVLSKARFRLVYDCRESEYHLRNIQSAFQISSEEDRHVIVTVYVNVCTFNAKRSLYSSDLITSEEIKSKDITLPSFRLLSPSSDEILTDGDSEVNIEALFDSWQCKDVSVKLVLWDWKTDTIQHSSTKVRLQGDTDIYHFSNPFEIQSFTVDVLKEAADARWVTLRVSLTENARNCSGKLTLSSSFSDNPSRYGHLIRRVTVERTVDIKTAWQPYDWSRHLVYFSPRQRFLCDDNGNRKRVTRDKRYGKNCTLWCHAYGRDISSIYISKLEPSATPIRSASYVLPDNAVAMLDVGVASPDNEGAYRCTAVDVRGRTETHDLRLYTSRFTEITYFGIGTDIPGNIVTITCNVSGSRNIAILVKDTEGNVFRLDDKGNFAQNITVDEGKNETSLTLTVPWDDLKIPQKMLSCYATGERGDAVDMEDLSFYHFNSFRVYPNVMRSLFRITRNPNRTVSASCTSVGKQPLQVWLSFEPQPEAENVTDLSDGITMTTVEQHDEVTVTVWDIPEDPMRQHHEVFCKARNAFGLDVQGFFYSMTQHYQ